MSGVASQLAKRNAGRVVSVRWRSSFDSAVDDEAHAERPDEHAAGQDLAVALQVAEELERVVGRLEELRSRLGGSVDLARDEEEHAPNPMHLP